MTLRTVSDGSSSNLHAFGRLVRRGPSCVSFERGTPLLSLSLFSGAGVTQAK